MSLWHYRCHLSLSLSLSCWDASSCCCWDLSVIRCWASSD